ncbi:unnamed protein product, partial [Ectocarpus sp. 12 AP-2014]
TRTSPTPLIAPTNRSTLPTQAAHDMPSTVKLPVDNTSCPPPPLTSPLRPPLAPPFDEMTTPLALLPPFFEPRLSVFSSLPVTEDGRSCCCGCFLAGTLPFTPAGGGGGGDGPGAAAPLASKPTVTTASTRVPVDSKTPRPLLPQTLALFSAKETSAR